MEDRLKALEEDLSLTAANMFADELADIDNQAEIEDDSQQRILSSVMRKAGFEMKETMTVKKTRRHGKRFVGFILAAAVLGAGAIGVGAYTYSNGMWSFASGYYFVEDGEPNEVMENLKSVTNDFDGQILENTFTDLDFTYEGIVNDGELAYVMITVKKTNGEPFKCGEEGFLSSGFRCESAKITDGNYDTLLYPVLLDAVSEGINEDGSATIVLQITNEAKFHVPDEVWEELDGNLFKEDESPISDEYVLSFTNLYIYRDPDISSEEWNDDAHFEFDSGIQDAFREGDTEKYDSVLKKELERRKGYAEECFEGTLTFTVDTSNDHSTHVQSTDGDMAIDVWLSSISIRAKMSDSNGIDVYEKELDEYGEKCHRDIPGEMEIYFKDGTKYSSEQNGYCYAGGFREYFDNDGDEYPTSIVVSNGFGRPIDCNEVDYVIVDGHKVEF